MTGRLFLPNNTVLVNFALIGRFDLLRVIAEGRSTWCYTVSQECEKSSLVEGLEQLCEAPKIFGEPLKLEAPTEFMNTEVFRTQLAKPGDPKTANLGEAESLAIITGRGLDAIFVTDDNGALGFAESHDIPHLTTWDLIKLFVRIGKLGREEAWGYVIALKGDKRRYMELRDKDAFFSWLDSKDALQFIP